MVIQVRIYPCINRICGRSRKRLAFSWSCRKTWLNGIYAFVGSAAYGLLMEVLQRYCTVSRTGELSDLMADMGGALLGVIVCFILFRK